MAWPLNSGEAVFIQIANKLRYDILSGKYPPDSQIPAVRQLAFDAAVNPNTMQKALSVLEEEGLLHSKGTIGRFVTSDENVLWDAMSKMKRVTVRKWIAEAAMLGITENEMINYIKEEGINN